MADVRARVLPPDEWERLREYGPFKAAGGVLPDPAHARVIVLENATGALVGCWEAKDTVILEGLFLSPEYRHSITASKLLFFTMLNELREVNVSQVLTLIQDAYVAGLAKTAGFDKLEGALHVLSIGRGI